MTTDARIAEADVTTLGAPPTDARVAEGDVTTLGAPPVDARIAEGDVTTLAAPPTYGAIAEVDVTTLAFMGPCATTRCDVWKITRRDGVVFGFTSLDVDVAWGFTTYKTCKSLVASASESASELRSVGSQELQGILDDDSITDEDLYAGLFDDAQVEVWRIAYPVGTLDPQCPFRLAAGQLGKVTRKEHDFVAEIIGPGGRLQQAAVVDVVTPGCRFDFGDPDTCGVDVESLKLAAVTITGSVGRTIVTFSHSDPGGSTIWNGGRVRFLDGRNAGVECDVETVDFIAEALSLWAVAPYPPQAGDTFDILPGCPYTKAGCDAYSNYEFFGGFPDLPGRNAMQSNADSLFSG